MKLQFSVFIICIIWCFDLSNAFETNSTKGLRIPLYRKKTPRQHLFLTNLEKDIADEFVKNDSIALYRFMDNEFYGKVVVGSPGKSFNIIFDTTWSPSWIVSSDCHSFGCYFHNKYNHRASSSYVTDNRKFSMDEGSFNYTGYYSYDTFALGHLRVNQTFIEMTQVNAMFIFDKADGVFGLGKKFANFTPFIYKLVDYGNISDPIFSIFLNRDRQSKHGGVINIGFIETKHIHVTNGMFDNITYLPVISPMFWQFSIDRIRFVKGPKKIQLCQNGCSGIVDTSNNVIIGPKADIQLINSEISAQPIPFFGRFHVTCDTVLSLPEFQVILNGVPFVLKSKSYIQKVSWGPISFCLSAFAYSDNVNEQSTWILGGSFLAEYYSIYDMTKNLIGFVKAA